MRHKKREEMQLMPPETHDQNDRKTQDRQNDGRGEMAGEGEGVNPNKTQRQHAQQIGEQNEHEQRKDIRREPQHFLYDIGARTEERQVGKEYVSQLKNRRTT